MECENKDWGIENGEWEWKMKMGNGNREWGIRNGEWGIEKKEWRMGNGE